MGPEAQIENKAREYLKELGGCLMKWTSPGNSGVPDRIAVHPNFGVCFMEFKAPGKRLTPLQREVCEELAGFGARIYADVDSVTKARQIIDDEVLMVPPNKRRHKIVDGFGT